MNLFSMLGKRAEDSNPVRIGMIGAGKFGTMFLSQVRKLAGIHLIGIADLSPANARSNLEYVGWQPEQFGAVRWTRRCEQAATHVSDDWQALVAHPAIDIVIECTGAPVAAIDHILSAFSNGKHVINVTVEADAFCGYALARKAEEAGVIYSMAYGDQPALTCDLVDWARTCGFQRDCRRARAQMAARIPQIDAGNGVGPLGCEPRGRRTRTAQSEDVQLVSGRLQTGDRILGNRQCHRSSRAHPTACSFRSAAPRTWPTSCGRNPRAAALEQKGMVEVASALTREGKPVPYDVRQGVWVVFEGETEYLRNCFPGISGQDR
jgi:hypothetical protein